MTKFVKKVLIINKKALRSTQGLDFSSAYSLIVKSLSNCFTNINHFIVKNQENGKKNWIGSWN
jgi:hypothetical protein